LAGCPEEGVEDLRVALAHGRPGARIEPKDSDQFDRLCRSGLGGGSPPFRCREVRREHDHLLAGERVEEGGAGKEPRIEPEGPIRDEIVDARRTQETASRCAASIAARGEHVRHKAGGAI
jgi:hypothetical protein